MKTKKEAKETYLALIEAGLELFRNKGYGGTGLQEIIAKAGTSKGGFYHYFKNKEEFGIQVMRVHTQRLLAQIRQGLQALDGVSPVQRIKILFVARIDHFDQMHYERGSLLMHLLTEASAGKSPLLKTANECYGKLYAIIASQLLEAQRVGEVQPSYDADELAMFIYSAFEGALIKARAEKARRPLEVFRKFLFQFLDDLK